MKSPMQSIQEPKSRVHRSKQKARGPSYPEKKIRWQRGLLRLNRAEKTRAHWMVKLKRPRNYPEGHWRRHLKTRTTHPKMRVEVWLARMIPRSKNQVVCSLTTLLKPLVQTQECRMHLMMMSRLATSCSMTWTKAPMKASLKVHLREVPMAKG
jgi:hypothetical protein